MTYNKKNDIPEENPIKKNLEEQFEQLGAEITAPEELEKGVFDTLDTLTMFGDVLDLFTSKFTQSEAQLMDLISNPEDSEPVVREDPMGEKSKGEERADD